MIIGYARVSTDDQHLDLQRDALQKAGCERLLEDQASGVKANRTGLGQLLMSLRAGDTVVIWRLDRLGRSLKDLIAMIEQFDTAHVGLRSVQENIDTTSIGGRLVFHLFGALAEFERHLIRERTQAGLSAARARGRQGGRKKRLDPTKRAVALRLYHERNHTVEEICRMMGVGRSTLYNYLNKPETEQQANAWLHRYLIHDYNLRRYRSEPHTRFDDWLAALAGDDVRLTPTKETVAIPKQPFDAPSLEYQFPHAIAAKLAIADDLARPLAKLSSAERAFIDQVLAETLIRNTVLSRVRHYFRHQTVGEDHAS